MTGVISRTICALVALHLVGATVLSQTSTESPQEVRAIAHLSAGEYASAARAFEELAQSNPSSPRIHHWNLYRGIARYHLEQFPEATALFLKVLQSRSDNDLVSRAHLYLGNIAYRTGDETNALHRYIQAWVTGDGAIATTAMESMDEMLLGGITVELQIEDIVGIADSDKRCQLVARLVKAASVAKQSDVIERLSGLCDKTVATRKPISKPASGEATIALLLPLTGELSGYGQEVLQGVQTAARSTSAGRRRLNLDIIDTQGDPAEAARQLRQISESDAVAVIGPLTSEEASAASAMAVSLSIPLIVPAASQSDFVSLSEHVYQLSPGATWQGKKMGMYARNDLRADTALVIALNSADHRRVADAFAEQFRSDGGTVLAVQYIHPRDKDFGAAIRDIKRLCGIREADSLAYIDAAGDTLSSDAIPLQLDCIFISAQPEQLRLLLPQLNFYNVHGRLLGTDSWSSKEVLGLDPDIIEGAVFPSSSTANAGNPAFEQFRLTYKDQFGVEPTRLAALGFDACNLIAASGANLSRKEITDKLAATSGYKGASGLITLSYQRRNSELPVFEIQSGKPKEKTVRLTADDSDGH
ncbi:MAG: penicillin-binding protein activator [Candidatus Zixiibacteriota bacterium]